MSPAASASQKAATWKVWSALWLVYIVWGSTYLAIRVAVRTMPPLLKAGSRFVIAGVILYLISRARSGRMKIEGKHWRSALIVGGLLLLGGNGGVVLAEQTTSSSLAALMVAATPLWFALFARIFLGETMTRRAVVGLIIGFLGIALLSLPSSGPKEMSLEGALLLLIAPMCWAAGSLYSTKAVFPDQALLGTSMQMIAGGGLQLVVAIAIGEPQRLDLAGISGASWLAWGYLIVFGSLAAFTAYIWLLKNTKTSLVATYAYVNPVVAVGLGWFFLSEPITPGVLVAAAVIVVGVAMIVSSSAPAEPELPL